MYLDERWVERQSWLPLTCAPSIRIGKTGGMAGHPIATKRRRALAVAGALRIGFGTTP